MWTLTNSIHDHCVVVIGGGKLLRCWTGQLCIQLHWVATTVSVQECQINGVNVWVSIQGCQCKLDLAPVSMQECQINGVVMCSISLVKFVQWTDKSCAILVINNHQTIIEVMYGRLTDACLNRSWHCPQRTEHSLSNWRTLPSQKQSSCRKWVLCLEGVAWAEPPPMGVWSLTSRGVYSQTPHWKTQTVQSQQEM